MHKLACLLLMAWASVAPARAATVTIAVAANFTAPMQALAPTFERQTGHQTILSFGATGTFHAQIRSGAPFQVLLAADADTPRQLEQEGFAVPGSRFTYAVGKLVLWSKQPGLVDDQGAILRSGRFRHIAVANPKLAPYGEAAMEAMTRLGVLRDVQPKIVLGENISQTYQFVASRNAELGFVALSQVTAAGLITGGSAWVVPGKLYSPIRQDAALLATGKDNPAATAFLAFLRSEQARAVIRSFGYDF